MEILLSDENIGGHFQISSIDLEKNQIENELNTISQEIEDYI
jgi:hypothetical protein